MNRTHAIAISLATITLAAVTCFTYNWYYNKYIWPEEIQISVIGRRIVGPGSLIDRVGYSHYGEGMFRWRYRVGATNGWVRSVCGIQTTGSCNYTKSRQISADVSQTITYSNGVVILEEVWS
jgi:hypothetical protein